LDFDSEIINEEATIELYNCSRGCFQFLVNMKGTLFYPSEPLAPEFTLSPVYNGLREHEDYPLAVIIYGNIREEKRAVTKPGPHDGPVYDFSVRIIDITEITKN
jgi:hypothetical protein